MLTLEFASLSDRGKVRLNNEDACGHIVPATPAELAERGAVFVVADGMGGHRGGEIASRIAVRTILAFYAADGEQNRSQALAFAFREANKTIIEESVADSALFGMGTTCTALALHDGQAYFAHVGDSRGYMLRAGVIQQITNDHSIVGEMVRSGIITDEDARHHPKRNVITRSLGAQEDTAADVPTSPLAIQRGDVFMLCSDGLTTYLSDQDIATILSENEPDEACRKMVAMANAAGGRDNITVQVVVVRET
ncbi:MAG: Stp1/IreP family PP2C-type Ser/Thr phosphatase [Candidatus Krumholzibacteria bacterium]|nr:Stp1/IreP family PP2C-type Ser/Thr phosphatase [Candidatus Krumholzibacteria bacterium]MDH4338438.1 Stp1/IreP family PP2C-type Ser/Thr phosphatase [Candidatus Krumholzibacteria bacterium]MDH5271077.1 Stp1/IreP family PP2C-type Ser/Thr phosphatase [Candidatus Krumholzibacteria bacterium]